MKAPTGSIKDGKHRISFRVYFEDTDAGGIVYHANFFRFAERARTEWLRMAGFEQRQLAREQEIIFVMRRAEIDYFKPAHLDDTLTIETHLQALGRTSMTMLHEIRREAELLASITVVLVCVNPSLKPVRFPAAIATAFEAYCE